MDFEFDPKPLKRPPEKMPVDFRSNIEFVVGVSSSQSF
jgi:hypothetical protein